MFFLENSDSAICTGSPLMNCALNSNIISDGPESGQCLKQYSPALYAFGNVLFLYWKIENNTKDTLERRCQNVNITFLLEVISEPRFLAPTLPTPTREHPHYISSNSRHISTFVHLPIIYPNYRHISTFNINQLFPPNPDTFLHFYTFQLFLSQFQANFYPFTPLSIPHFKIFLLFNCFSPEADTCLHFCNCFCLNSIQKYTFHIGIFSPNFSVQIIFSSWYSYSKRLSALSLIQD